MAKNLFKKKILHRAKYRGIKELDLLFSKFADKYYETINDNDLKQMIFQIEKYYIPGTSKSKISSSDSPPLKLYKRFVKPGVFSSFF